MGILNKQEKAILEWLGKVWEIGSMTLIFIILFIDPMRGRLYEWDWLQSVAMALGICILVFSVWLDKFLNAVKEILEDA